MDDEWLLARKLLADHEARSRLLKAMQGNPGWFVRLRGGTIQNLLREDGEVADGVMLYLGTMIKVEQEDVVDLLRPFVGQSSRWNERIDWMLDRMLEWRTLAAVELFGQLLQEISASEAGNLRYLDKAVKAYPWEGCRLIRLVLDRSLEAYIASGGSTAYRGLLRAMPLHDYTLSEALKAASKEAPSEFVEALLPWLQRVVALTDQLDDEQPYFAPDVLSNGWYDGLDATQDAFIGAMVEALTTLAKEYPGEFRTFTGWLG